MRETDVHGLDDVLGLDIGGAHLKAATATGHWVCIPFAMWLRPTQLAEQLAVLAAGMPACRAWAVTMTGEMADVFYDRAIGVRSLVEQTVGAAHRMDVQDVAFYSVDGCFLAERAALADPDAVASANWHALASWVAGSIEGPGLLIDVGSTTTDIIAIDSAGVATASRTDFDRLVAGELVYLGGGRTPVCALVQSLPFLDRQVPVMREVFATTDDCALVLGLVAENAQDRMTSDGGPRTVAAAVNRLARTIGLDHRRVSLQSAGVIAQAVIAAAGELVAAALASQSSRYADHWILSGHTADYFLPLPLRNDPLRNDPLRNDPLPRITRLSDRIGPQLARVAPAFACAQLRHRSRPAALGRDR